MTQRGAIAGLDFGMTNSLLCIHEPDSDPVPFIARGAEGWAVPTVVAEAGEGSMLRRFIGLIARHTSGFVENFKIGLPRAGSMSEAERRTTAEFKAASSFLDTLFRNYFSESGRSHFDKLVVTVPETWLSGGQLAGVHALKDVLGNIGIANPQILSEPVAASCFFAYRHQKLTRRPFDGHVLVFDHGGSTLDLCVARLNGTHIHTITRVGRAGLEGTFGFGGVQFDHLVLERIARRSQRLAKLEGVDRARWLHEFERMKRIMSDLVEAGCQPDASADARSEPVFSVADTQVRLGDLLDVFEAEFAAKIRSDVETVLAQAKALENIDTRDPDKFRVVMVGGFSEFAPIRRLLAEIFRVESGTPEVLNSYLTANEKWLAVAKGACLVAANAIDVKPTCPFTFGITSYVGQRPYHVPLARLGDPISQYAEARYADTEFKLAEMSASEARSITFFIERAGKPIELPMKTEFSLALPDYRHARSWRLGCVLEEGTAILKLLSDTGHPKSIRMGDFMAMSQGHLEEAVID